MTVIFSKRCELGLQAVLFLSAQDENKYFSAKQISNQIDKPKEFIAKTLQFLVNSGIVGSKRGKEGGFYLLKQANQIRLIDIVQAIDGEEVFNKCVLGFQNCSPDKPCPVHNQWGELRTKTEEMLSNETLAELRDKTMIKLKTL